MDHGDLARAASQRCVSKEAGRDDGELSLPESTPESLPLVQPAVHGLETTPREKIVARSPAGEPKWKSEFDGASKKLGKAVMSWVVLITY